MGNSLIKCSLCVGVLLLSSIAAADVESGPTAGMAVPKLDVYAVVGDVSGESLDFTAKRDQQPTVYCFIPADKFSRPTARLMRILDEKLTGVVAEGHIVAVWVTGDVAQSKEYLARVNMSLKLSATTLCVFEGDASGPGEWGVNTDADITVVVVNKGQVLKSFGFVSANDTLTDEVLKVLSAE